MATVEQILNRKGTHVLTIESSAAALDAAMLMNEHEVGSLVVVENERLIGILTERDLLRRVIVKQRNPAACPVGEIMTRRVICCGPKMPIKEACAIFMHKRIRHLPVVDDDGALRGIISIGDVNAWEASEQQRELHYLHEYLHTRV